MSKDSSQFDPPEQGEEEEEKYSEKDEMAPQDVVYEIIDTKGQVIVDWYTQVNKEPPRMDAFLEQANASKNRFKGVLLYDRSRVIIKDKRGSDYYHASWVDSYDKKDGYILAQAPFDETTETNFWRMVMYYKPVLIVLLGSLVGPDGAARMKCFWPTQKQERQYVRGNVRVRCTRKDEDRDHNLFDFNILGRKNKNGFQTQMLQNRKWFDDKEMPDNILDFRSAMQIALARAGNEDRTGGPLIFLCPSGAHRCGTFAVLNIVSDRLKAEKKVGLERTVNIVRSQRYGTIALFDHYKILHDLFVRQSVSLGIVDPTVVADRRR